MGQVMHWPLLVMRRGHRASLVLKGHWKCFMEDKVGTFRHRHTQQKDRERAQEEDCCLWTKDGGLGRGQPHRHPHRRLPASRIVREFISVAQDTQSEELCSGSPGKLMCIWKMTSFDVL